MFDVGLAGYRPKIISVWNNKGGVSKTTTTHSLGFALAQDPNTRVLMVDADGQQNLMQMTFRHAVDNQVGGNAGDYQAYIASLLPANRNCSSLEEATRQYRNSNGTQSLGYPHAFPVVDGPGTVGNKRLFMVLAGDDFEKVDMTMTSCGTVAQAQAQAINGVSPFPGMVWHAIWRAGRSVNADIILLDLAPAISSLNKNLLMHSDYFMTPCLPEQFSQKALERITLHFGEWYADFFGNIPGNSLRGASRGYVGVGQPGQANFPLPSMRPQYAGCILSGYSARPTNKRTLIEVNGGLAVESPNGHAASRLTAFLILRSQQLAAALQPPPAGVQAWPHQATQTSFAVPANQYPNAAGSNFYPQPHVLARIRKAVSGFENATVEFGKPFAFLTDSDLGSNQPGINIRNTPEYREAVAHYQRIYMDMATFLRNLPLLANDANGHFDFNLPPNLAAQAAGAMYGFDGAGRFH